MSKAQLKFMKACGQTTSIVNFKQVELYQELIREEVVKELFPALEAWKDSPLDKERIRDVLDAIGDSLVVIEGLAYSLGTDPQTIKAQVDESNLTKIPLEGNSVKRREDGKILKPDHFREPDLGDLVDEILASFQ